MPVLQIGPRLAADSFMGLVRTEQVRVLRSAHYHLSNVASVDAEVLGNFQRLADHLETPAEPLSMMRLTVSTTLYMAWKRHFPDLEKTVEPSEVRPASDRPADAPAAPPASTFTKTPTPVPPDSSTAARLGNPVLTTPLRPPTPIPERPQSPPPPAAEPASPAVPPPDIAEDSDASSRLYPAFWWDPGLAKTTRLDFKGRALAHAGAVSVLNQSEEEHARFLVEVLTQWVTELRDAVMQVKDRKNRAEAVTKAMADRAAMIRETISALRERRRKDDSLAVLFWENAAESSAVRLAVRQLSNRDIQSRLDESGKTAIDDLVFGVGAGVLEHCLLPLFAGGIAPSASDDRQGQKLAEDFRQHLDKLPMIERRTLNAEATEHLPQAEAILRTVAAKLRESPDSLFVRAFLQNLEGGLARIPTVAVFIRRSRDES